MSIAQVPSCFHRTVKWVVSSKLHSIGNARLRWWRSCRKFVRACDSLDPGHSANANPSRGWGASPCRIRYASRHRRRFVLTESTGVPPKLIRRLPNRLIRMDTDSVVYDAPVWRNRRAPKWRQSIGSYTGPVTGREDHLYTPGEPRGSTFERYTSTMLVAMVDKEQIASRSSAADVAHC